MYLNAEMSAALDRIAARADDVRRAFTPGAQPAHDDAIASPQSTFTLDPLSVALPNDTYALVETPEGVRYARNGSFHIDGTTLVDARNRPVLGRQSATAALEPLQVDAVDAALHQAANVRIEADGSLAYTRAGLDPRTGARTGNRIVGGRIALARFPAATRPPSDDGDTVAAPAGVVPHVGLPGDGTFAALQPMRRERSGVDVDASLIGLKDAYLAFDALQAAQHARGSLGKTAMDLLK